MLQKIYPQIEFSSFGVDPIAGISFPQLTLDLAKLIEIDLIKTKPEVISSFPKDFLNQFDFFLCADSHVFKSLENQVNIEKIIKLFEFYPDHFSEISDPINLSRLDFYRYVSLFIILEIYAFKQRFPLNDAKKKINLYVPLNNKSISRLLIQGVRNSIFKDSLNIFDVKSLKLYQQEEIWNSIWKNEEIRLVYKGSKVSDESENVIFLMHNEMSELMEEIHSKLSDNQGNFVKIFDNKNVNIFSNSLEESHDFIFYPLSLLYSVTDIFFIK